MDASLTETLYDFVTQGLDRWGYLLVFLIVFLETSAFVGVFVPGEMTIILGGAAAARGILDFWTLVPVVVVAAILGDTVGYIIGRRLGRGFILRHPRLFHIREPQMERVDHFFARHGGKTVFISRWSAFLRVLTPLIAGSSRMPYLRFMAYNVAGAVTWALVAGGAGYLFGRSYDLVERWFGRISLFLLITAVVGGALYLLGRQVLWPRRERLGGSVGNLARGVLGWGPVRGIRRRFAPQIAWLARRLSVNQAYGLGLTLGLFLTAVLTWALAALTESVLTRDPLTLLDRSVAELLHEHAVPQLTVAMKAVTNLGSGGVLIAAGLVIAGLLLWRRRAGEALLLVTATVGAAALGQLVKVLVDRPRPDLVVPLVQAEGYSFPSGHATASMAFYLTLGLLAAGWVRRWESRVYVLVAALGTILLIGFSRLYLGVHYLSDVLAGYALGALWVTIAITTAVLWQQGRSGPEEPVALVDGTPGSIGSSAPSRRAAGPNGGGTLMTTEEPALAGLSREEIETMIAAAEEELEDLAHERNLTLGGTGVHLGAQEAERLRHDFERDESRVRARLDALREALAAK